MSLFKKEIGPAQQTQNIKDMIISDKIVGDEKQAKEENAVARALAKIYGEKEENEIGKPAKKEKRKKTKVQHIAEQRAEINKRKNEIKASRENYF